MSPLAHRHVPSNNTDARSAAPDMVVLHYTDMADVEAAIRWLAAPESRVSAHYVITAAGELVQMVDEAERAWHAGVSFWDGTRDVNGRAIGIELDSEGHRPRAPHFPDAQIHMLLRLMDDIRGRWTIPARGIVAHSDIAPMRKIDPGEGFPWARLAAAGHALVAGPAEPVAPFDAAELWQAMAQAGYGTPASADEEAALGRAFHRRHRQAEVDCPADGLTLGLALAFADAVAQDRDGQRQRRRGTRSVRFAGAAANPLEER